jgi:hypothetical protein
MKKLQKKLLRSGVLVGLVLFSCSIAVWASSAGNPTANPPTTTRSIPINQTATDQVKTGGLSFGSLSVYPGSAQFNGAVTIDGDFTAGAATFTKGINLLDGCFAIQGVCTGIPADFTSAPIQSGVGAPSGALGSNGDYYINTASTTLYGPKTAGSWGSPVSLIGPKGPTGAVGPVGDQGATGGIITCYMVGGRLSPPCP